MPSIFNDAPSVLAFLVVILKTTMSAYAESDARQQACEFCSNSGIKVFDGVGDNSDNRIDALAELS